MLRGELFATDMVRAYQEGRKLHTARPVKPYPNAKTFVPSESVMPECVGAYFFDDCTVANPKHRPGDYIYCRETFFREDCTPDCAGRTDKDECPFNRVGNSCYGYKAQYTTGSENIKWRPSIHMPREAARLFFRVTGVEAMRLEDVTEEFAREDGFLPGETRITSGPWGVEDDPDEWTALDAFKRFWADTYGDARWMWVYWMEPCSREEAMGDGKM